MRSPLYHNMQQGLVTLNIFLKLGDRNSRVSCILGIFSLGLSELKSQLSVHYQYLPNNPDFSHEAVLIITYGYMLKD